MSKKSTSRRRAARPEPVVARWRQRLLLVTLLPMLIGVLLFIGAWADVIVLRSAAGQTVAGALLALLGFAASNALQAKWLLAGGWAVLGIAIGLGVGLNSLPWAVPAGIAFGALGLSLIVAETVRQYRRRGA